MSDQHQLDRREFLRLAGFSAVWMAGGGMLTGFSTVSVGGGVQGFAPHRYVFALRGDGQVIVIDPTTETIVRAIDTGGKGGTLASLSLDGRRLYVANNAPDQRQVTVIDANELSVLKHIETGNRPKHPVVSPDGALLAVNHSALDDGKLRIALIATLDDTLVRTVELPIAAQDHKGDFSMHGAWSPDGQLFAVGSYADNRIFLIRRNDYAVFDIAAPGNPHYFDWRGQQVWATIETDEPKGANSSGQVLVLDVSNPAAPRTVDRLAFSRQASETENLANIEGHHGVFSNDGRRFITCNRGAGSTLEGVTVDIFDADSREKIASFDAGAKGVGHAYLTPDGRFAIITQYNDVKLPVVDLESLKIVKIIDAGNGGHLGHAAFSADGRTLFVSNRKADEVLVIDTARWEIRKRIATAASGQAQAMVLNAPYGIFERVVSPRLT